MKRIDINDIFDDNDITLFTMMSSYARVFRRYTNKKEYETACEYMNAIIDYAASIENEVSFAPNFKTEDLISAWLTSRPNIKKSAIEYSSGRRGQEKKKAKNSISERSRKTPLNKGDINPIKGDIYPLKSKEEDEGEIKEEVETESTPVPSPVVTEKDIIQFYLDTGLQSKFLKADMTLSDFAVKNITAYTEKNACGINTENFEDYKKYAIACYNKAKEGAGLKES